MGDLRVLNSSCCPPSASFFPSARSTKACNFACQDPQKALITRINQKSFGNLYQTSQPLRKFPWRALLGNRLSPSGYQADEEGHMVKDEEDLNIFERFSLAWRVLFPKRKKPSTPAEIAKQRLKMILISDRCSVNDNAKRKIVSNIVGALANFVEIESQDRVRLNVSADPDLGTVYSVSVPVRRVKPEYQDNGDSVGSNLFREDDEGPLMEEAIGFPAMESGQVEMSIASYQEGDVHNCAKGTQEFEA